MQAALGLAKPGIEFFAVGIGTGIEPAIETVTYSDAEGSSVTFDSVTVTLTCDSDGDGVNDGQSDADELTCGSDPLNAGSTSPDFDGDNVPDCVTGSLPVTLSYFLAMRSDDGIRFQWSTATETGNASFNLYVETPAGRQQINPALIPMQYLPGRWSPNPSRIVNTFQKDDPPTVASCNIFLEGGPRTPPAW